MDEKQMEQKAEAIKRLAFCSISVSTISTLTAIILIPSIYTYLQHIQSALQNEVDFCQHRTGNLINEYERLGVKGEDRQNNPQKRDIFHRSSGVSGAGGSFASTSNVPRARGVDNYGVSSGGYANVYASAPASSPTYAHRKEEQCCSCGVGAAGAPGAPGRDGSNGYDGKRGLDGLPGPDGKPPSPEDLFCFDCPVGPQGLPGKQGLKGPLGMPGLKGREGNPGSIGLPGPLGPPGETGMIGLPGLDGLKGEPGLLIEVPGIAGPPGLPGPQGLQGSMGLPGFDGKSGQPGPQGAPGEIGLPGLDGLQGIPGDRGLDGLPGEPGSCSHCAPPRTAPGY